MKKRIFAFVLLFSFLLPLMLACGGEPPRGGTTDGATVDTGSPADTGEPADTDPPVVPPEDLIDTEVNAVVFASADFQGRNTVGGTTASGTTDDPSYNDGNANAAAILKRIIQNMKKDGYETVDAAIFCGDYDIDTANTAADTKAGIEAIEAVYAEMGWDTATHIFLQGNHEEKAGVGTNGLSGGNRDAAGKLGAFDTEHYGLYLLHEDYFPYKSSGYTTQKINTAAAELGTYLDEKLALGYDKPIFIAAHVPLHYNLWMTSGLYAKAFFDVINEAAGKGLRIIYLFGHDHGMNDQYIGGTDIYLPVGSPILVSDLGTKATKQMYTLNFTYMTAGLSAYTADDHSKNQLSGTIFEIYDDRVEIKRYNDSTGKADNGLTNVGNLGEERPANTAAGLHHFYYPTEYPSPQTVSFDKLEVVTAGDVTVRALGIAAANVSVGEVTREGNTCKLGCDIRPLQADGSAYSGYGTVTLPLPASDFADARLEELVITAGGQRGAAMSYENGMLQIWVPQFAPIEITYTPIVLVTVKRVTLSELVDGGRYLVVSGKVQDISRKYNNKILSPEPFVKTSPSRVGLAMVNIASVTSTPPETLAVDAQYLFTFHKDDAGTFMLERDGQFLVAGATSGGWAGSGDTAYRVRQLKYGAEGTAFTLEAYGEGGLVSFRTPVDGGNYPCYMYVTSYGNTCLIDLKKDNAEIRDVIDRTSYYYIYEVQN